ncbi:MBL fold metallo-hydrolase [uncultured Roseibium sp.]|uniref:MBL fold metallo-hydrolase n=1 Tax=uncultured Roseibium sp. TaxID=1936171 RepID=UPI002625A2F8|nr:MBL fold metallo-hydrolase [uncultured Roseibium sp.]
MRDFNETSSTLTLGDLTITSLSDGELLIPADYFSNTQPHESEKVTPSTRFGANSWLIETKNRKILVDAGSGNCLKERFPDTGRLNWQDPGLELKRSSITDVVITHMHADHIGGLSANGTSLFANAEIHIQAQEWAFWTDPKLLASADNGQKPMIGLIQTLAEPLKKQLTQHPGDVDLGSGIGLLLAQGHTPGHQVVHLTSGHEECFLLADAMVSDKLQFSNPDITYALDSDPADAVRTRRALFDRIASERIAFSATHMNTTAFAMLTRQENGYAFEPC